LAFSRVFVISQLPPPIHGSSMMTKALVNALEEAGVEWTLVDRRFSTSVSEVGHFNLRKIRAGFSLFWRTLRATVGEPRSAAILFATNRTFSFLVDVVISELLRMTKQRRILYIHTDGFSALAQRNRVFARLVARLFVGASAVVCLGPTLERDVQRWTLKTRVRSIPNIAERPTDIDNRYASERPYLLFLSNLIPEKGALDFVEIARQLAGNHPRLDFLIAGAVADEAFAQQVHAAIEKFNLVGRVKVIGAVSVDREKWSLVANAQMLVFPSTYPFEAQPLTIVEALSTGTPVAAYDTGGIRDIVDDGNNGILGSAEALDEFAERIARIVSDPAARSTLADGARRAHASAHTRTAYRDAWLSLLAEIGYEPLPPRVDDTEGSDHDGP